jgi:hypothetical protein
VRAVWRRGVGTISKRPTVGNGAEVPPEKRIDVHHLLAGRHGRIRYSFWPPTNACVSTLVESVTPA